MANNTLSDIKAQIAKLQAQADEIARKEFDGVLAEVKEKIAAYGFTAKDLGFASAAPGKRGPVKGTGTVPPKYRNKKGPETWSGRGIQPRWVASHIAAGGKIEDLAI